MKWIPMHSPHHSGTTLYDHSLSNGCKTQFNCHIQGTDDHEFERGMKLEAVNPENPNQICAATITKIVGPLLWIHLDNMRNVPSHIEDIDSQNLFPVGWCESNSYTLKPPRSAGLRKARKRRSSE